MKAFPQILCGLLTTCAFSQNIQVDSQTYTPQQLVENILIDSDCIDNVEVTYVLGGDFGTTDRSYGYFEAAGSSFPFESGIVLSTGKLANVRGPNSSLSDDNATNWAGDADLEAALNENNTTNATIIAFDFTSAASQISFRYIFASEEYQEGNPNTCQYSDLFGFLIRPANAQTYQNIALVPDTQIPVKVTTVHPTIPGACEAQNEAYFESFNGQDAPINFNGQTKILTATATLVPNQTYHVKLVIADEQNYRYDSAVFLEAGSFKLSTDLGPNRLIDSANSLCEGESIALDASASNANSYKWFKNNTLLPMETSQTLNVAEAGIYTVEITLDNSCISFGKVIVEVSPKPTPTNSVLIACDQNQDGLTYYNLFDAEESIVNQSPNSVVSNFYLMQNDAFEAENYIANATSFENTSPSQIVFARVQNSAGCIEVAELELQISNTSLNIATVEACDGEMVDGIADFNLNEITASFESQIPTNASVSYYLDEEDAFSENNPLDTNFQNDVVDFQTLFVKVESNNQCFAISEVNLKVLGTPMLEADETVYYCNSDFPETTILEGGVLNDLPSNYYYEWQFNGNASSVNTSFFEANQAGVYTVTLTDPNGCATSRTITVEASTLPIIEDILITEGSQNNSITVITSTPGNYGYALDDPNGSFQGSETFTNVAPGFHKVYVRDSHGCGIAEKLISVLGFPRFFTPNGDTFNERWQLYGVNSDFNQGIEIQIFNRYGKRITQLNNSSAGWDGTLNGQALPSDDYWFLATLIDGRTFSGHFALKR
jgi:gliding motility-associated-like protein